MYRERERLNTSQVLIRTILSSFGSLFWSMVILGHFASKEFCVFLSAQLFARKLRGDMSTSWLAELPRSSSSPSC